MVIPILVMLALGLLLGMIIAVAVKIFRVETDPRIEAVAELLPGANCGGCGRAGCMDFAKAVVAGDLSPNACPVSSQEIRSSIARALGIELGAAEKLTAVILCGGDEKHVKSIPMYNGVNDCVSAAQIGGGPKSCQYGCLGFSSCARACPFGAIEMRNSLAIVNPERCVGCGVCVKTCPRKLIKLIPADASVHIYCNSPAKVPMRREACSISCISCRKCVKAAPEGSFVIDGLKISVNYNNQDAFPGTEVVSNSACPTGCLHSEAQHLELYRAKQ